MQREQTLGGLTCQVFDPPSTPEAVAVVCHGFGASGTDLVPLGHQIVNALPDLAKRIKFVFPAAPLTLDHLGMYGSRAWWPLDIEKLNAAIMSGELRDLRKDNPPELPKAREMLTNLINEVSEETGVEVSKFVLGGFSQGSMLSTDVAFHLDQAPGGLCIWSGTLLCEDIWTKLAPNRSGLKVFQSHGRQDQILPFSAAELLRDLLIESGLEVEFVPFNGIHTIPNEAITGYVSLLQSVLDS